MGFDILLPFIILIVLTIYLIYTRRNFEKNIVDMYDKKFEEWKQNSDFSKDEKKICKQLVGLVYKEEYNITIEMLDESAKEQLARGKFKIKDK